MPGPGAADLACMAADASHKEASNGIAAALQGAIGADKLRISRILQQALAHAQAQHTRLAQSGHADVKQALGKACQLLLSTSQQAKDSLPECSTDPAQHAPQHVDCTPQQQPVVATAPKPCKAQGEACGTALDTGHTPARVTMPAPSSQPGAKAAGSDPELAKLLNPALAKAMLPDGVTPDGMTRLRHGLAKTYGYTGSLEGWSVQVVRKQVASRNQPSPDAETQANTVKKVRTELVWTCPGFPKCRSIPVVARALKLVSAQPGTNQAMPTSSAPPPSQPAPRDVQPGQTAQAPPAPVVGAASTSAQSRVYVDVACRQPQLQATSQAIAATALQHHLAAQDGTPQVVLLTGQHRRTDASTAPASADTREVVQCQVSRDILPAVQCTAGGQAQDTSHVVQAGAHQQQAAPHVEMLAAGLDTHLPPGSTAHQSVPAHPPAQATCSMVTPASNAAADDPGPATAAEPVADAAQPAAAGDERPATAVAASPTPSAADAAAAPAPPSCATALLPHAPSPSATPADPAIATPAAPPPEPLSISEALRQQLKRLNVAGRQLRLRQSVVAHALVHSAAHWLQLPDMRTVSRDCAPVLHRMQAATAPCTAHRASVCEAVQQWHVSAAEEVARRREAARRLRLDALRSSDMQAYLALVKETRSERLQSLLDQTDGCLRSLAQRLGIFNLLAQEGQQPGSSSTPCEQGPAVAAGDGGGGGGGDVVALSHAWSQLAARLTANIPDQPALLTGGQLREYQMHGLRWMVALHKAGLGGILADEMGLGKTVQVIALVCHLIEVNTTGGSRRGTAPFLIAAPASVLPNWAAEFKRWAPGVKVVVYRGSPEVRERVYEEQLSCRPGAAPPFQVLLTSYDFLMGKADKPRLTRFSWSHLIVDEGHRLKDASCRLARELTQYKAASRLLLTGTPLQNQLQELWSLLHFLLPGSFGPADDFNTWFAAPLEALRCGEGG